MTSKEALEKMFDDLKNYESQFADGGYYANEERFDAVKKDLDLLEEYRKIEKELGIDLIKLFKALNGCWFLQISTRKALGDIRPTLVYQCGWHLKPNLSELPMLYALKDYGKTWALTREELEK